MISWMLLCWQCYFVFWYKLKCFFRDFHNWKKPYSIRTWKIRIILHAFEIANPLLTRHLLYLVPWMNSNMLYIFSPRWLLGDFSSGFQSISHLFFALTGEILSWAPRERVVISLHPCIMLYFKQNRQCWDNRVTNWWSVYYYYADYIIFLVCVKFFKMCFFNDSNAFSTNN